MAISMDKVRSKRVIFCRTAGFLAFLLVLYQILGYLFIDDIKSQTRITFHDFYEHNEEYDTFFIGSSHFLRGIDVNLVSERTGLKCFNLGTISQRYVGTYFLLKEANREYDVKKVYLEISPQLLSASVKDETPTYIITDYTKWSLDKLSFIAGAVAKSNMINCFSRLYRNSPAQDFSYTNIKNLVLAKNETYWNYQYVGSEDYHYGGAGHWHLDTSFEQTGKKASPTGPNRNGDVKVKLERFDPESWSYFDTCVDYCKEHDIDVTLVIMPFSDLMIGYLAEDYQEISDYMKDYADGRGVEYVDFNTISRDMLRLDDNCFSDLDHLNGTGAEKFSAFLIDYINGEQEIPQDTSVTQRMKNQTGIYGIVYNMQQSGDGALVDIELVSNMEEECRWSVEIVDLIEDAEQSPTDDIRDYRYETIDSLKTGTLKEKAGNYGVSVEVGSKYFDKDLLVSVHSMDGEELYRVFIDMQEVEDDENEE